MSSRQSKSKKNKIKSPAQRLVDKANEDTNAFDSLKAFHRFSSKGLDVQLACLSWNQLDKDTLQWIIDLLERNMKSMYEESSWGWNPAKKKEEMTGPGSRYLLACDNQGKPLAFSHFQYDMDEGDPVLYCYELQAEPECRRKGLGQFMLQVLELLAFRAGLTKVILTVFKHNEAARAFFWSCSYTLDETSPEETLLDSYDYEILSKFNKRRAIQ